MTDVLTKLTVVITTHIATCVCIFSCFSHVRLFAIPWAIALQSPLSMGFSRQVDWSGLPFPSPGDFPDPGMEPMSPASPALQADSLLLNHWGSPILQHIHT